VTVPASRLALVEPEAPSYLPPLVDASWGVSEGISGVELAETEEKELGTPYPAPTWDAGGGNRASLPGRTRGDPTREGHPGTLKGGYVCGSDFVPRYVCRQVGRHSESRAVVSGAWARCERRDCPICAGPCEGSSECHLPSHLGGEWAHAEGREAADRWEDYLEQMGFGDRPLRQVIISAPAGEFDPSQDHVEVIRRVRHRAEARLKAWSWVRPYPGASVVVHLWRGCFGEGYTTWGPHAHALSLGIDVRKTEAYESRTGWVVKQATRDGSPKTPFTGYRGWKLRKHLIYELGHAAILSDRPALVWVGPLRTWKRLEAPEGEEPTPECVECRERMERWSVLDHLVRSVEGWGMWWVGCDRREWIPVRLLEAGSP